MEGIATAQGQGAKGGAEGMSDPSGLHTVGTAILAGVTFLAILGAVSALLFGQGKRAGHVAGFLLGVCLACAFALFLTAVIVAVLQ